MLVCTICATIKAGMGASSGRDTLSYANRVARLAEDSAAASRAWSLRTGYLASKSVEATASKLATGEKATVPGNMNSSEDKGSEPDGSARKTRAKPFEYVEPIGARVVVRKDEAKRETRGGIALPDQAEIPTITGRIVTISALLENDSDVPLRQYDKVLYHPKDAIPVDFEPDNQLFVVPVDDIVAVFRREPPGQETD